MSPIFQDRDCLIIRSLEKSNFLRGRVTLNDVLVFAESEKTHIVSGVF